MLPLIGVGAGPPRNSGSKSADSHHGGRKKSDRSELDQQIVRVSAQRNFGTRPSPRRRITGLCAKLPHLDGHNDCSVSEPWSPYYLTVRLSDSHDIHHTFIAALRSAWKAVFVRCAAVCRLFTLRAFPHTRALGFFIIKYELLMKMKKREAALTVFLLAKFSDAVFPRHHDIMYT